MHGGKFKCPPDLLAGLKEGTDLRCRRGEGKGDYEMGGEINFDHCIS